MFFPLVLLLLLVLGLVLVLVLVSPVFLRRETGHVLLLRTLLGRGRGRAG